MRELIHLEYRNMTVAQYEAKYLIAIKADKAMKFQDGLKPYLKNKISILK